MGVNYSITYTSLYNFFVLQFCYKLRTETWNLEYDDLAEVPYAYSGRNWVSYDDVDSITKKVEYAKSLGINSIMVWSIETDDFHGLCGDGDWPLLRAINKALEIDGVGNVSTSTVTPSPSSTISSTVEASTTVSTPFSTSSETSASTSAASSSVTETKGRYQTKQNLKSDNLVHIAKIALVTRSVICKDWPDISRWRISILIIIIYSLRASTAGRGFSH